MFGSCARGEEKYDSDIDIICIVNKTGDEERRLMRKMRSLAVTTNINDPEVDVVFKYNNGDKNYLPWLNEKECKTNAFLRQLRKNIVKI